MTDVKSNEDSGTECTKPEINGNEASMSTIAPSQTHYLTTFNWREFVCGWCAALVNISITYPINKIIFRQVSQTTYSKKSALIFSLQMLHGVRAISAYKQLRNEGLYYLYRGILPPMCQKTISLSIMFGGYEEVRRPLMEHGTNKYLAKASAGLVAGSCEAILTPFERTQTLLQDSAYHHKFRNMPHAFRVIVTNYGLREFYRGFVPILCRNGPSNAIFFIVRDELHDRIPANSSVVRRSASQFVCGAMIGVVLSTLFYPLNVVKVTMQSELGGEFRGIFRVMKSIYVERGGKLRYMYRGCQVNGARAFISWGVMNTAYEQIKKIVY